MANIYYDSNYSSQVSLPSNATFQSITTNGLVIPKANNGDILITDSNHAVSGLTIGPVNYVLQSNGSQPQWSNTLNLNTVTSTAYIIPGTSVGDLFTVNGANTLIRVPLGSGNSKLISGGGQFNWAMNQLYTNAGSLNNIPQNSGPIFSTTSMSVSNAYRYRLVITGKLVTSVPVALSLSVAATGIDSYTFSNTNTIYIQYIFNATFTGPLLITLSGFTGVATLASLYNMQATLEFF